MDWINIICIATTIIIVLVSCFVIYMYRNHVNQTMNQLFNMIDSAIDGKFTETTYDESKRSALEAKLNQYLWLSATSSKNLLDEKDKINSLISDISHQTKTPIANILLYSQLLLEKNLPEESGYCTRQIITQTEKLNFLITSLIKTSRLENGIITVKPKRDSVGNLLIAVHKQIASFAESKHILLTVEESYENAIFDMKWTIEAIYNIVDNAVKYTPEGGSITITTVPYELFCRIDIADTGIGIKEGEISKVFSRFYRSEEVSQYEGVGLGLYLSREIISAEGGYIKVSSVLGKGTVFSVFLPK